MSVGPWSVNTAATSDSPPRPTARRSRWGLLFLALAVLSLLITTGAGRFEVAGRAQAVPIPPPPATGSCLELNGAAVTAEPCDGPHNAEVTAAWAAGLAPTDLMPFHLLAELPDGDDTEIVCQRAESDYLNYQSTDRSGLWRPVKPVVFSRLIAAPAGQRTPSKGWTACVVTTPDLQRYAGSVRGGYQFGVAEVTHRLPSFFGSCVLDAVNPDPTGHCSSPHPIEVLGTINEDATLDGTGLYTGDVLAATLHSSCSALAAALTGAADPTFGGALTVAEGALIPGWAYDVVSQGDDGGWLFRSVPTQVCYVATTGGRLLDETVIGVGGGPLPLT